MNKILTFIIPSYNVEQYLDKCLGSFLDPAVQDYLEVIVVDDGSKDGTAAIAAAYVDRYPNTYRLIRKSNGGHGSTINVGSKAATGTYFKVIDADDWVVTENMEPFVHYLKQCMSDVVLTPFHTVDMNTGQRVLQKMYIEDYNRTYTPNDIANDWKAFDRCTVFHGITYRTEFYHQYYHHLPEKIFYEDQEYATIPFCHAEKVSVLDLIIYQYLVGNSNQSVAVQNQISRINHLETVIKDTLSYRNTQKTDLVFSEKYWLQKTVGIVLSYYVIMCISNPKRAKGRKLCQNLNRYLKSEGPILYQAVKKKYFFYYIFSILGISQEQYESLIHSSGFRVIRKNHKIERL